VECLRDDARNVFHSLQQVVVFCDGRGNTGNVRLLESVLADDACSNLSGYGYHRYGIHVSVGDAGHQVRCAGTTRGKADADLARGTSIAVRHVRRPLFMADEVMSNEPAVIQRVV